MRRQWCYLIWHCVCRQSSYLSFVGWLDSSLVICKVLYNNNCKVTFKHLRWAGQLRIKRLEVISLFLQIISSRTTFKAVLDICKLCVWWMSKKKRWYKDVDKVWSNCHEYEYESAYSGQLSGVVWSDHCDHCDQLTIGIKTSCWLWLHLKDWWLEGKYHFGNDDCKDDQVGDDPLSWG